MIATETAVRTLKFFVNGSWEPASGPAASGHQSRDRRGDRAGPLRHRRRSGSRRSRRSCRVSEVARSARSRSRAGALSLQGAAGSASRRDRAHPHHRERQDSRRRARIGAPGHPDGGGRLRHAEPDDGAVARKCLQGHRLPDHPAAARRLRRHLAVQFPGDGADVDVPLSPSLAATASS